ncbi:MAG: hypothetical protein F6K34_26515 [Okeania sp. SIO4D6]|nr:hypothetical protein [Okeania sp. SIO4D6]
MPVKSGQHIFESGTPIDQKLEKWVGSGIGFELTESKSCQFPWAEMSVLGLAWIKGSYGTI